MYMWSWLHQEVWAYSEWNAPYQQESIITGDSVSVSFCPSGVAIVEDCSSSTHVSSREAKSGKKKTLLKGFKAEFGLLRWLPLLPAPWKLTTTTHTTTITATKFVFWSEDVVTYRHCGPHNPPPGGCYKSWAARTETCNLGFSIQCSE